MLGRILIAVDDDGAPSEAAIEQGLALAQAEGARVVFAHVASILGEQFSPNDERANRAPERTHVPVLRKALDMAERCAVEADAELLVGYAPKQIAALADELDVDLVVVGSRHLTGARRMLHGSTSRAVLDATKRPLLIVTEPAPAPAIA
jgi:nucleotide-binding universal stress UspA family protein